MNTFLRLCLVVLFTASGAVLCAADRADIDAEMKRVESLEKALEEGGAAGVLATTLPAPLIRSPYYAERLAKLEPERLAVEQAKREFGFKLAVELDETAAFLQKRTDSTERAKQAGLLLDLAAWLRTARGYGNYVLFSRCESLATVPLAYLTADLDYPLEKVGELRRRILASSDERAFRVAVLNDEAPAPFIGALSGNESAQDDQIQIAWSIKWNEMRTWFKSNEIKGQAQTRERLPEHLALFFTNEYKASPFTTVNNWNNNRHQGVVFGMRDVQVKNVDMLMLYREKVGTFPTQPPSWWKPTDKLYTAREAAFEDAWRPHEKQYGPIFQGAAITLEAVVNGSVWDRDTQYTKRAELSQSTEAGKPTP